MTTTTLPRWCRGAGRCTSPVCVGERGSADRAQMRVYAMAVTLNLMGKAACVHCGVSVSLWDGEVDRTEEGCYRPTRVLMTCVDCNNAWGSVPMGKRAAYVADVEAASAGIVVPRKVDAQAAYNAKPHVSRQVERSPYL